MANFIDNTYFTGPLLLAQKAVPEVAATITAYVNQFEPEYLKKVLGYSFWKQFMAGLEDDPVAQKWIDLRDGSEFTLPNGTLTKWNGFVAGSDAVKLSPIANYVYWQFRMNTSTLTTGTGETVAQNENSLQISPGRKMCDTWNAMVVQNVTLWMFLYVNREEYGLEDSDFLTWCGDSYALRDCAWGDMAYKVNDFDL